MQTSLNPGVSWALSIGGNDGNRKGRRAQAVPRKGGGGGQSDMYVHTRTRNIWRIYVRRRIYGLEHVEGTTYSRSAVEKWASRVCSG